MKGRRSFTYFEIPNGDHDSALWVDMDLETLEVKGYFPEDRFVEFESYRKLYFGNAGNLPASYT
jgi:hypothetical protein